MPTPADYVAMLDSLTPTERADIQALAVEVANGCIDQKSPDDWEAFGRVFAERAWEIAQERGPDEAIGGVGLAACMFKQAEQLRCS